MSILRVVIVLFLFFESSFLLSQRKVDSLTDHRCEAFRADGWAVPGLLGAKKQARGPIKDWDGVFLSVLDPGVKETWLVIPRCRAVADDASEVDPVPIKVLKLWSFDSGGVPFAYRVEFADEVIHPDGTRVELASSSVVFFFDTDGSGRFTLVRTSSMIGRNLFYPDFVPEWTKVASPAQPQK